MIEISDINCMMKNWLICNYGGLSRIVGDIVSNHMDKRKPRVKIRRRNLFITQPSLELYRDWRNFLEVTR